MKTEEEINGLAEKQYPIKDGTTDADQDTLLTFQNILIKGYKQALSDIQEEKDGFCVEFGNWLDSLHYTERCTVHHPEYGSGLYAKTMQQLLKEFKLNHKK